MANFDVSKAWVISFPPNAVHAKKAAEDLSRYIGLLAGKARGHSSKTQAHGPAIVSAESGSSSRGAAILLHSDGGGSARNGFFWKVGRERLEIHGESDRGLCNGIYSFLSALGIGWPAPGQEILPSPASKKPVGSTSEPSHNFLLTIDKAGEPSGYDGSNSAAAPWRRFVPAGKKDVKNIFNKSEAFIAWAARRRYDALVFPLASFVSGAARRKLKEFKKLAGEYGIALEAGGRDLSSLVPRKNFFLHRDCYRMVEGRRVKTHHFCPTNPGTIRLIEREGKKLFHAALDVEVFHLWPDKGAESVWCSCPTCRAFTPLEQNRIGVNAAADVLVVLNPGAFITYLEKSGEEGNIPLRKNLYRMEKLPEEKEFPDPPPRMTTRE